MKYKNVHTVVSLHGETEKLLGTSFIKALLVQFVKTLPSWTNHLKYLPSNTITLKVRISLYGLKCYKHSIDYSW